MLYAILGNTYLIREYLKLSGCVWNGMIWKTENKDIKKHLTKLGLSESEVKRLKVKEIIKKPIDKISE